MKDIFCVDKVRVSYRVGDESEETRSQPSPVNRIWGTTNNKLLVNWMVGARV